MKILIVDDENAIRQSIKLILCDQPYDVLEAKDLDEAYALIISDRPDLLLLDVHFKGTTSLSLMKTLLAGNHKIPTIMLSGAASASEAAEAIKLGAYDFIE